MPNRLENGSGDPILSPGSAGSPDPAKNETSYVYKISWPFWLVIALLILVAPFASDLPDGLEKVAHDLGFMKQDKTGTILKSPLADYNIPGLGKNKLSNALAGAAGMVIVVLISWGIAHWRSL